MLRRDSDPLPARRLLRRAVLRRSGRPVYEAAGTSAIRVEHGIERHHRDVHTITQHVTHSYARYEDAGRLLFGLPPEFFLLEF